VRNGSQPGPTILFDAHMDVVPEGDVQKWSHYPYSGTVEEHKLYGRGATDTKNCLAGMVVGLGRVPREGFSGKIVVTGSIGEEEIEGAGLSKVVEAIKPDLVIVGEPSDCILGIGQKGRARVDIHFEGRPAHSSTPHKGDNAVYKAVDAVKKIRDFPAREDQWVGKGVTELVGIISKPFPGESTVPFECVLQYDRRLVVGEKTEDIEADFRSALDGISGWKFSFKQVNLKTYTGHELSCKDYHPAWRLNEQSPWLKKSLHALERAGIPPRSAYIPYCTNGSYTAGERNIPTIIFGPSTIHLAHVIDEYIEIDELERGMLGYMEMARCFGKG
jgi:putative selenium metabolism hydrolase